MKVLIVTAMWPTPHNPAFGSFVRTQVECLKNAGVDVEVMALEGRFRKLIYLKGALHLRRRIGGFDLVHAHYGYVGVVARTQWRVPVILTYHGSDLLGGINEHGKRTLLGRMEAALSWVTGNLVDAVIVQSTQMARRFQRPHVYVIPHEVDLEMFQPTSREEARHALGLCLKKKYLLFAANPDVPIKRFPLAKAVAENLHRLDPSVELLVVYKEPQPRLALYMSACDALVFPSFQEGSPNIVKQAMACNLPIAATDVGDVRDLIGDTDGCYICPPTVESFSGALVEILRSSPRTKGREQMQHLSGSGVARRLIGVYEDTLQRRTDVPKRGLERAT
jgi:glycosyltransferase involved in cell wall biosynthesis